MPLVGLPRLFDPPGPEDEDTLPGEGSGVRAFFEEVVRELEEAHDEGIDFCGFAGGMVRRG